MEYKDLFSENETIQVSVVKIGVNKLTKSLVDQMDYLFPFDNLFNFTGGKALGYLKMKEQKLMVGVLNEKLYKCNTEYLVEISRLNSEALFQRARHLYDFQDLIGFGCYKSEFYDENDHFEPLHVGIHMSVNEVLTVPALQKLETIKQNSSGFIAELNKHKIYI